MRVLQAVQDVYIAKHHPELLEQEVFTFVTVYYKYGETGTETFETLRDGLVEFAKYYSPNAPEATMEALLAHNDEELLDIVLTMGTDCHCISFIDTLFNHFQTNRPIL